MGRNSLSPGKNQPECDLVLTPPELAKEIIDHFSPSGIILDPCRGEGAFFDQFPSDDKVFCELTEDLDFFDYNTRVDWIITNPPWSKMRDFIRHGCSVAKNVVYLSTLTHFCTKARLRDIRQMGYGLVEFYCVRTPKTNWPSSGFQLGAMHIQANYTGSLAITGEVGG